MKYLSLLLILFLSNTVFALSLDEIEEILKKNNVKHAEFQASGFALLTIPDQNPILMSNNGRYIIQGDLRIFDNFNNKELRTADGLEKSSRIIKLENVIPDINEIVSFSYGDKNAQKKHLLIIDPYHKSSLEILKQAKQVVISDDVLFNFVLSTNSLEKRKAVANMHCNLQNANEDRIFDLLEGNVKPNYEGCSNKFKVMKGQLFRQMINATEIPLLINQYGLVYKGLNISNDLKSIL